MPDSSLEGQDSLKVDDPTKPLPNAKKALSSRKSLGITVLTNSGSLLWPEDGQVKASERPCSS